MCWWEHSIGNIKAFYRSLALSKFRYRSGTDMNFFSYLALAIARYQRKPAFLIFGATKNIHLKSSVVFYPKLYIKTMK